MRHFHIARRDRYTYSDVYSFKDNKKTVFTIFYDYATQEDLEESREKKFCDIAVEAFMRYKAQNEILHKLSTK